MLFKKNGAAKPVAVDQPNVPDVDVNATEVSKNSPTKADLAKTIIGIVLCVVFGFVLICNLMIIIGGAVDEDNPPSVFGVTPLIVVSDSMTTDDPKSIKRGDLIFLEKVDFSDLKEGDIITYKDSGKYTTHRIVGWDEEAEGFEMQGDSVYNTHIDTTRVTPELVVGRVTGNVHHLGSFIEFLEKPTGMLVCVGIPIALYIAVDVFFRLREEKKKNASKDDEKAALEAELERLRALAGESKKED